MTKESQQQKMNTHNDVVSLKEFVFGIKEWLNYLLSKWLIIFGFGVIGGALGYYYAVTKQAVYTATTTFVLEDEKGGNGLGNLAGLASMAGVDLGSNGGGIFQGDNILELYRSRKMLQQTLLTAMDVNDQKHTLIDRYIQYNGLRRQWLDKPELLKLNFQSDSLSGDQAYFKSNRTRDSIINQIITDIARNYLSVGKPDKKLSIIKVDVRARDEVFAKAFNEALVKNVNDFYVKTKTKKSLQNVQIMQRKTDSVRAVMNGAIYTSAAVSDATPNLNPTRQVQRIVPSQRAQFSAETNKAILSSLVQNLEMSKLALMKEAPLLEVIDEPIYPLPVDKVGKIKGLIVGFAIFNILIVIALVFKKLITEFLTK